MAFIVAADKKSETVGTLVGLALIIGAVIAGYNYLWGEKEGETKYEDCRNKITIKEDSGEAWFKTFTCNYYKAKNGKILGGLCVHVETEGPVCQTAYIYYKKSQIVCGDPKFPVAGEDGECHVAQ